MVKLVNTKQIQKSEFLVDFVGGGLEVEKLIADSWVKYQTLDMDDRLPRFGSVVPARIIPSHGVIGQLEGVENNPMFMGTKTITMVINDLLTNWDDPRSTHVLQDNVTTNASYHFS